MDTDMPTALRARQLLRALRDAGDWQSRNELAAATGKKRLSPNDVQHLKRMLTDGLIESSSRKSANPFKEEEIYRAKPEE